MEPIHLEDRAILAVGGAESRPFLQGLITNDIDRLGPGRGLYAALLSPQGKIGHDFFLVEGDGAILVDCAANTADALLKKFGVTRAIDIKPEDFKDVIAACAAADHEDDEDEAPRRRGARASANARTPLPMETVINAAPDIKTGFDLAAKAIHAKRPKS